MADTALDTEQTAPPKMPAPPNPRPVTLGANALKSATYERGQFFCRVSNETTFEQVMTPNYWANHVASLSNRPFPLVEVVRDDGSMDLLLRCVGTMPGAAFMRVLVKHVDAPTSRAPKDENDTKGTAIELPPSYKATMIPAGENKGWLVRLPNGEVLVQRKAKKQEAADAAWAHFNATNKPQV